MGSPIKVVLQENVDNLGESGDVVRVRPGYARNFLIPRGLAAPATSASLARVDELKRQAKAKAEKEKSAAEELGKKLSSTSIKLSRAVGEENKMYGSVTTRDIEEAYAAQGIEIDRKRILSEPLKTLGSHEVRVRLHPEVIVNVRIEVVKET
jgi:large subunit ribosomal protein L9